MAVASKVPVACYIGYAKSAPELPSWRDRIRTVRPSLASCRGFGGTGGAEDLAGRVWLCGDEVDLLYGLMSGVT